MNCVIRVIPHRWCTGRSWTVPCGWKPPTVRPLWRPVPDLAATPGLGLSDGFDWGQDSDGCRRLGAAMLAHATDDDYARAVGGRFRRGDAGYSPSPGEMVDNRRDGAPVVSRASHRSDTGPCGRPSCATGGSHRRPAADLLRGLAKVGHGLLSVPARPVEHLRVVSYHAEPAAQVRGGLGVGFDRYADRYAKISG